MSFDVLGDLNWLAVIVAAAAYFALGVIWYSRPLLGPAWSRAGGVEIPEGEARSAPFYLLPLITCFVAALAAATLAEATGSDTVGNGIALGLGVGMGIGGVVAALGAIFDRKPEPAAWAVIVGGYHVVGLLLVGIIVSAWQ